MKKALIVLALAALLMPALAAADSWTGWITDDHCGAKGAKAGHEGCARKCSADGGKLVFFNEADQKLYQLDDQKLADEHLGHQVKVTGELEGDAIKVQSIEAAAK